MLRQTKSENPNATRFPLFSLEDYDFEFRGFHFPIGLKSTYPEELIRRVAAASISFQMGNSGVDYTYKRYLKDQHYELGDGSRLDLRITGAISRRMEVINEMISRVAPIEPKSLGELVCEWTFARTSFSIKFLVSCANRGAFFEAAAIARMILEQMAWAAKIHQYDDETIIQKESASKAIGWLAKSFPVVGRLYGWLSIHAHWAYEGHIKAWSQDKEGRLSTLLTTSEFKARALILSVLLAQIAERIFVKLKGQETLEVDVKQEPFQLDPNNPFLFERRLTNEEFRSLLHAHILRELAEEIGSVCPEDADVRELANMTLAVA